MRRVLRGFDVGTDADEYGWIDARCLLLRGSADTVGASRPRPFMTLKRLGVGSRGARAERGSYRDRRITPPLMSTRNGVAPTCCLSATGASLVIIGGVLVAWARPQALGPHHSPCPQIVELPLIAPDHGAQARSKRDRHRPNWV